MRRWKDYALHPFRLSQLPSNHHRLSLPLAPLAHSQLSVLQLQHIVSLVHLRKRRPNVGWCLDDDRASQAYNLALNDEKTTLIAFARVPEAWRHWHLVLVMDWRKMKMLDLGEKWRMFSLLVLGFEQMSLEPVKTFSRIQLDVLGDRPYRALKRRCQLGSFVYLYFDQTQITTVKHSNIRIRRHMRLFLCMASAPINPGRRWFQSSAIVTLVSFCCA